MYPKLLKAKNRPKRHARLYMVSLHSKSLCSLNIVLSVIHKNTFTWTDFQLLENFKIELGFGFATPQLIRDKMLIDQQRKTELGINEVVPFWIV